MFTPTCFDISCVILREIKKFVPREVTYVLDFFLSNAPTCPCGCTNIRNMLSSKQWNNKASDIKLVYLYSARGISPCRLDYFSGVLAKLVTWVHSCRRTPVFRFDYQRATWKLTVLVRTCLTGSSRKEETHDICTSEFVSRRPDAAIHTTGTKCQIQKWVFTSDQQC